MTHSRATGSENYRLPSVAGSGVLPVPECCRSRSAAGYRGICRSHPYWQGISFKTSADSRFTGYRELLVPEWCRFPSVLLVTEKSTVPMLTDKKPASNPVLTTGSPVTELYQLQKFTGDKLVGQEVFFRKIPLTDWLQNLRTRCRLANLQGQLLHKNLRDNGEVTRVNLEHQSTGLGDLPRD